MNGYCIDTSIWIDYFNGNRGHIFDVIDNLIDEKLIHINGIIQTELLAGAANDKDYTSLSKNLQGLAFIDIDRNVFEKISYNAFFLKRKGVTIPLSDLIIATQCIERGLILIENDRHYSMIAKHLPLQIFK